MRIKKVKEHFAKGIMGLAGSFSAIVIILIIFFLFSQGLDLFKKNKIEDGYTVMVSKDNPVKKLSSHQLKEIFDGNITSWRMVGGMEKNIVAMHSIDEFMDNPDLDLESAIVVVPKEYISECEGMKELNCGKISFKDFFLGKEWMPTATPSPLFGVLPIISGTLLVSLCAILFALPLGICVAIYLSELSENRTRKILKPTIEILASIPSVVYGFFGLVVIVPLIQKIFNLDVGQNVLSGAIILAIMALPTIITVSEDAIRAVPRSIKEASLALGANKWQTIYKVVIPHAITGIATACVLGIGRAVGETMAVLMVTGNSAVIPHSLLEPIRTIPATIAAELGEAPMHSAHYEALFVLGCILFIITMIINLIVERISSKNQLA